MRSLFATAQQPNSRDIFSLHASKFFPIDKLIKLHEGMLIYTVNLLGNFFTDGHVDRRYQLRNDADLGIPLHATQPGNLFAAEQLKPGITD